MPINGRKEFHNPLPGPCNAMRITPEEILSKKKQGKKITALTAYDYPFAKILDAAGVDIILVGDSVGMALFGHVDTLSVTMADMLRHTEAVSRAVQHALVVADMPYGSYDDPAAAVKHARMFLQTAGAGAVKLEGGSQRVHTQVEALRREGIAVMGHVGMLPQSVKELKGYRVRGRATEEARQILEDAVFLDRQGVFSLVIECVPKDLGSEITRSVQCPTIGIGAGAGTDGQVLVLYDLLGLQGTVKPKFVRTYADLSVQTSEAVKRYCRDVIEGRYPLDSESY